MNKNHEKTHQKITEHKELEIKYLKLEQLKKYEQNVKIHSKKQIEKLVKSIQQFGMVTPIIIDKDFTIIAGHGRVEALKKIGMTKVPTILLDHLT